MSNSKPPILDLFGEPDINFLAETIATPKEKSIKKKITQVKKDPVKNTETLAKKQAGITPDKNIQQAFLPGLSRRGRPRSKNPISAVERTAEHRRKRLAEGSKRVEMILAPEVARQLEALAEQYKEPRSEVIATLVTKAYLKVFKAKPTKGSVSKPDQI
jgi:hypothetical protein